jgi:predicted ester cyclase
MNTKEMIAKDRRAVEEAWCKGNLDALNETMSPDVVVHMSPFPDIRGLEAFKQSFMALREGYSEMRLEWSDAVCEGDAIAQRITFRMKHTSVNPVFKVPPTGKEVAIMGSNFVHVKHGKIVEEFQYIDFLGTLQQFGIVPAGQAQGLF